MRVQSLGWEYPLEDEMATQSSIFTWKIQWTEESGKLQSIGLQSLTGWSMRVPCTKSMDMNLSKLQEISGGPQNLEGFSPGIQSLTWLSDWTATTRSTSAFILPEYTWVGVVRGQLEGLKSPKWPHSPGRWFVLATDWDFCFSTWVLVFLLL